jgi:hypothetical protein
VVNRINAQPEMDSFILKRSFWQKGYGMNDQRPKSDGPLRPLAVIFIELPLLIVHIANKHVCVMTDVERSDNGVIGSWLCVRGDALPDQKNLLSEALDIVSVCHYRGTSDVLRWFLLVHLLLVYFLCFSGTDSLAGGLTRKGDHEEITPLLQYV